MKLKKGSAEAKRYMAKIRAKKKPVKKLGYSKNRLKVLKETTNQLKEYKNKDFYQGIPAKERLLYAQIDASKKLLKRDPSNYGLSGSKKNRSSLGASGDYAKFEIAVIKNLSKLLKKPYKKVLEIVNTDDSLLSIISKNFDKKVSVSITAKELKAKLITVAKKSPLQSFVEILNKLPKKDQVSRSVKFPIKLPATVQIGSNKNIKINNVTGSATVIDQRLLQVKSWQNIIEALRKDLKDKNITASQKTEIKKDINNAKTFLNHKKRLLASDLKKIK